MAVNIEQMRSDMAQQQKDLAQQQKDLVQQQKWETRKFVLQALVATAASVGAGVALANYVNSHRPPETPPPPQIIYLQPGPPPTQVAPGAKP